MTRAERLNERFKTIQATLEQLYGRERAFGAATAAWLMALQYTHRASLLRLQKEAESTSCTDRDNVEPLIISLEDEMEKLLQSFHAELCEHLGLNQAEAWRLAKAFKEVIHDVCHQGG